MENHGQRLQEGRRRLNAAAAGTDKVSAKLSLGTPPRHPRAQQSTCSRRCLQPSTTGDLHREAPHASMVEIAGIWPAEEKPLPPSPGPPPRHPSPGRPPTSPTGVRRGEQQPRLPPGAVEDARRPRPTEPDRARPGPGGRRCHRRPPPPQEAAGAAGRLHHPPARRIHRRCCSSHRRTAAAPPDCPPLRWRAPLRPPQLSPSPLEAGAAATAMEPAAATAGGIWPGGSS
jgi:hypothetical protein